MQITSVEMKLISQWILIHFASKFTSAFLWPIYVYVFSSPLNQLWHLTSSLIELNNIFTMCLFLHLYDSYDFTFKNIIL